VFEENARERRPSRDEQFASRVMDILRAARSGDAAKVKQLLERDPRLAQAKDPLGNTALILAVNSGQREVAQLLMASGARPDIYEAAAIGDARRAAELISLDTKLLDSYSPEGFTPLGLAAHFGHKETARFLLAAGADANRVSKHEMKITPLHAALFGRKTETAMLLLENGADPRLKRGGSGWPRAGWTAIHYAAQYGMLELIRAMIERGASINARDDEGRTPLRVAIDGGQEEAAKLLAAQGAKS
jgi:ankyrin repeat protein